MKPKFEPTDDGLEIIDPIERHRYRLTMHESVDPVPVDTDRFQFPVTTAVEVTAGMITLPTNENVYVRDEEGTMISEVYPDKQLSLPSDKYTLDLSGPLKVYAQVDSSVYIYSDSERTYITLDDPTQTIIGARSYHRRPAGTITTTTDPHDLMKAVSTFGSALKSITPERSYPTHRGHPPAVEIGNELDIPEKLKSPDTGITIEIPPKRSHIFVVSPLAYYLGAEVVSSSEPRLTTDDGFTYELERDNGIESAVKRVLKQVFFLDCVVRTEGPTPLPLHERRVIESKIQFDVDEVYKKELGEQIKTYLSSSFEDISTTFPDWEPETRLKPTDKTICFLPYLVDNLSTITIQQEKRKPTVTRQSKAIEEFTRGDFHRSSNPVRGTGSTSTPTEADVQTVVQSWNSINSTEVISRTPLSSFHHSFDQSPRSGPIEIKVVCNDLKMKKEFESVDRVYGERDELPFTVTTHHNTNKEELENILSKNTDFFHFIGHIDKDGFQCVDGKLDAASLEKTGTNAFFLNACQSYDQGIHLIESGSIGGIVTLNDIINSGAIRTGCMIARLLNRGFPLYAALDIAQSITITGKQYSVVGSGMATITQSEAAPPNICLVEQREDHFSARTKSYMTTKYRKGSLFIPYIKDNERYFLIPGESMTFELAEPEMKEFLEMEEIPVVSGRNVFWSENVDLSKL